VLYNTPDTVYHRTAARLKRTAAPLIEDAKKVEASLVFNPLRAGKTLDMKELEPIEGWEYSVDPWPGHVVREMSPLSTIGDGEVDGLEKELVAYEKEEEENARAMSAGPARGGRGGRGERGRGRWFRGRGRSLRR
jgi:hypothetical protein